MDTAAPRRPLAVLVVDDNPADVYFIRRVLEACGFTYTLDVLEYAHDVLQFVDRMAQPGQTRCPDLLLLDYSLPGLETAAVVQRLTALPPCAALRIILITGTDDPAVRQAAQACGADAFFVKPLGFQAYLALGALITTVLTGGRAGGAGGP